MVLILVMAIFRWEQVVDAENCLHLGGQPKVAERDEAAVQKLRWVELETGFVLMLFG